METNIVFKSERGVAVTTSYLVAETFGKNHAHVLRDIDKLNCSDSFRESNFGFSVEIKLLDNGLQRKERYCVMTKDGFTILAMGYTGKKAMEFKEKYIEAFNSMEKQLSQGITQSLESLSRKQILQMALEAEEEKERLAARLALSESRNREMAASIEGILPRLEAIENRMSAPQPAAVPQYAIPKASKKKIAEDPRNLGKKYPGAMSCRETVKWLNAQGLKISRIEFYAFLRDNGFVSRDDSTYNLPTDESVDSGWMIPAQSGTSQSIDGRHYYTPYFTTEGRSHFLEVLKSVKTFVENPLFVSERRTN